MFPGAGYVTGRLREAGNVTYRLREASRLPKVRVRRVDEVSEPLREPGIITGYRNENCTVLQAVVSLFNATNETVNFWTHFLASVYFIWLLASLSSAMPLFDDPYLYPLTCYLFTSCGYPLMSCIAHAFSCLSITATHVCYFLDYAALSVYTWGVAYAYYSYCLAPQLMDSWFAKIFLPVALMNAVSATFCACLSRFIVNPIIQKSLRVSAFVVPAVWDLTPLAFWLYTCDASTESCGESRIHHINQYVCVIVASFFYGSHFPERLAPGRFDIVGHSHNLLHVFSFLATNEQMRAVLIDLKMRRHSLESTGWIPNLKLLTLVTPCLIITIIVLVLVMTRLLSRKSTTDAASNPNKTSSSSPTETASSSSCYNNSQLDNKVKEE